MEVKSGLTVVSSLHTGVNKKFKQAGATLLEALSFLAIAAIVVIGATSLLTSAFSSSDTNTHLRELISLKTAVKSYLSGQGNYAGATNTNLIAAGLVPSTLSVSGTNITNSYGGAVTIASATGGTSYSITTAALTKQACVKLVPQLSGFLSVQVGMGVAKTTFPYAAADAITDCGAGPATVIMTAN